jgi:hypothetical protein
MFVQVWTCDSNNPNHHWLIEKNQIKPKRAPSYCLDLDYGNTVDGTKISALEL